MFEADLTKGSPTGLFLPPMLFQNASAEHVAVFGAPASVTPTSPWKMFLPKSRLPSLPVAV